MIKSLTNDILTIQDCYLKVIETKICDLALSEEKLANKELMIKEMVEKLEEWFEAVSLLKC